MISEVAQMRDSSVIMLAKLIMQHLYFFTTLQENKSYLPKAPYGSIMSQVTGVYLHFTDFILFDLNLRQHVFNSISYQPCRGVLDHSMLNQTHFSKDVLHFDQHNE